MVPEYDLARRVLWNLSFSVDKDSIQSNVWTIKWICTRTIQEVINSNKTNEGFVIISKEKIKVRNIHDYTYDGGCPRGKAKI